MQKADQVVQDMCKIIRMWPRVRSQQIRKMSQDRNDPVSRLEAELIIRTSHLKTENDDLKGRVEVLERCLKLITDNLQAAKDLTSKKGGDVDGNC